MMHWFEVLLVRQVGEMAFGLPSSSMCHLAIGTVSGIDLNGGREMEADVQ